MAHSTPSPLIQRAVEALHHGAWAEAEALCRGALATRPGDAQILFLLGQARAYSGDTQGAEAILERARAAAPGDVAILNSLGGIYGANGKPRDAQAVLERAIALDPRFPWAQQNLGSVLLDLGETARARSHFETALQAYPNFADAISGLAEIAEREHRLDDAAALAAKAAQISPRLAAPRLLLAKLALRRRDYQTAIDVLTALAGDVSTRRKNRTAAFTFLGEAYEGLGAFERAFAAFSSANDLQRSAWSATGGANTDAYSIATMRRLVAFARRADVRRWRSVDLIDRDPVFFVGFPRSGTTLMEQILASHPDIEVAEEEEGLVAACGSLIGGEDAFDRWARLSDDDIAAFRGAYWRHMKAAIGGRFTRPVFVDKLPLNTALLPVIFRVFPQAKVLFAVRDPRDVVVSCFRQNFALNPAMANFLSLEGSVRYYDAVMEVAAVSRERFALDIHNVRYEALVNDFEGVVGGILSFLELPWSDAVRRYADTARRRRIRTPSASRVVEPIGAVSIGRWRGYRRWLEPHLPVLDRWIDAFGYRDV